MPDVELHGTVFLLDEPALPDGVQWHAVDLRSREAVAALIATVRPDQVYHLAGQAFVPRSFDDPWDTLETNIRPQLYLMLSCLALDLRPRFLITASAEVYGAAQTMPISEDAPLQPSSPYSVSKVTQDMLGLQYYLSHNFPVFRIRAFNHLGPGQSDRFVAPAFAMQIARIEAGLQPPVLEVGDLTARRDFTDVRDIVQAYHLIMERGTPGAAYNVASGQARSIQSLLDNLLREAAIAIEVRVDPARLRQTSIPVLEGDITRLQAATGWQPTITFEQTLHDVLADCRQRVKQAQERQ